MKFTELIADKDEIINTLQQDLMYVNEQFTKLKIDFDNLARKVGQTDIGNQHNLTNSYSFNTTENWCPPRKTVKPQRSLENLNASVVLHNNFSALNNMGQNEPQTLLFVRTRSLRSVKLVAVSL